MAKAVVRAESGSALLTAPAGGVQSDTFRASLLKFNIRSDPTRRGGCIGCSHLHPRLVHNARYGLCCSSSVFVEAEAVAAEAQRSTKGR
jgi:hypothetical protein